MNLNFEKTVDYDFDKTRDILEDKLQAEGFGVITEIDVTATMKEKLDVDFRKYLILGACSPPFAHDALLRDLNVGLFMPCNVVIYEDDQGKVVVSAINISAAMGMVFPKLMDLAMKVSEKLEKVVNSL